MDKILKTDPCPPYLLKYSPDVLKKKTDKKCFRKVNIESNPQEILDKDPFSLNKRIPITAYNETLITFA